MHEPEKYTKTNSHTQDVARTAIKQMGHLIKWNVNRSDTILDIGCGPGNILVDIVLPQFKGQYSTCYATDISETMVEFAAQKYRDRMDLKFITMDIMDVNNFLHEHGQVDHVISTFVFHWVASLETGLANAYDLLKRGGDFFIVHLCHSDLYLPFKHFEMSEKWGKYFAGLQQFIPRSMLQPIERRADELRDQLTRIGFTEVDVRLIPYDGLRSFENQKMFVRSIHPLMENIPEGKRDEYIDDYMNYALEQNIIKALPSGELNYESSCFVAYAKKPE